MQFPKATLLSKLGSGIVQRRFSVFTNSAFTNVGEVYERFFGAVAESETVKRTEFRSEFSTVKDSVKFSVSSMGPRLDVQMEPASQVPNVEGADAEQVFGSAAAVEFLCVANDEATRAAFRAAAADLASRIAGIKRLALSEQLLWKADGRISAYKKLSSFLPSVQIDPDNSSDFFYRINRPRTLKLESGSFRINRLSEWGCIAMQVHISAGEQATKRIVAEAAQLKTDVNTNPDADFAGVSPEGFAEITTCLFDYSLELSENGDTP